MCRVFLLLICCLLFNRAQSSISLIEGEGYSVAGSKVKLRLARIEGMEEKTSLPMGRKFTFHILDNVVHPNDFLGQLTVTWHPGDGLAETPGQRPFFFLDHIYIGREATADEPVHPQKQGYGTEAMNLLLIILRKSPLHSKEMTIRLDCLSAGYLPKWYESFGFQTRINSIEGGTQSMSCKLSTAAKNSARKFLERQNKTA